jgi:hypothetical protein
MFIRDYLHIITFAIAISSHFRPSNVVTRNDTLCEELLSLQKELENYVTSTRSMSDREDTFQPNLEDTFQPNLNWVQAEIGILGFLILLGFWRQPALRNQNGNGKILNSIGTIKVNSSLVSSIPLFFQEPPMNSFPNFEDLAQHQIKLEKRNLKEVGPTKFCFYVVHHTARFESTNLNVAKFNQLKEQTKGNN